MWAVHTLQFDQKLIPVAARWEWNTYYYWCICVPNLHSTERRGLDIPGVLKGYNLAWIKIKSYWN
jgi:hypothetical protein